MSQRRRAFTLVEVLVALGIAAALAATAIPIYGNIQQQAQNNAEVAQANAVAQAVSAYYGVTGCYPDPSTSWGVLPGGQNGTPSLTPYYGATSMPAQLLYFATSAASSGMTIGGSWVGGASTAQTIAIGVSNSSTQSTIFAVVYLVNGPSVPTC